MALARGYPDPTLLSAARSQDHRRLHPLTGSLSAVIAAALRVHDFFYEGELQ